MDDLETSFYDAAPLPGKHWIADESILLVMRTKQDARMDDLEASYLIMLCSSLHIVMCTYAGC